MRAWHWITIGAVLLATSKTLGPVTTEQVKRIAFAISKAEGYGVPGAIPTVRNNPGNIRSLKPPYDIATYPSVEAGWAALYRQITLMLAGTSAMYKPTMTLAEVARVYTGEARYMDWARNVAYYLGNGASPDSPFGELGRA